MPYPEKVYLNGAIIAPEDAKISVFDKGFIFGDGVYEVLVRTEGRFFFKEAHLHRLQQSLDKIALAFDAQTLVPEINRLLVAAKLEGKDALVYIQISRGTAPRQHAFPKSVTPTVMMYAIAKTLPAINRNSVNVITREDFRWQRCDIKMTSLLGNIMLNETAMENACYETILVRENRITEASHCNVFFVKGRAVYTHPADRHILNGITRQAVIMLCREIGITIYEEAITLDELYAMDEAFLAGTSSQIAAIKKIDQHSYLTEAHAGPITEQLQSAFAHLKKRATSFIPNS